MCERHSQVRLDLTFAIDKEREKESNSIEEEGKVEELSGTQLVARLPI